MGSFDLFMVAVVGNLLFISLTLGGVSKKLDELVRVEKRGRDPDREQLRGKPGKFPPVYERQCRDERGSAD